MQQIGRILTEINERIDDTREVLNISLDSQRNRILTLNLQTSLLTLSLTAIAVPAGILGMNIPLGLEEDPTAFSTVISAMGAVGICMYIVPVSYLYYGFFRTSKTRVKEVVALQNLVHDMDVIERTFYKMAATRGGLEERLQGGHGRGHGEADLGRRRWSSSARPLTRRRRPAPAGDVPEDHRAVHLLQEEVHLILPTRGCKILLLSSPLPTNTVSLPPSFPPQSSTLNAMASIAKRARDLCKSENERGGGVPGRDRGGRWRRRSSSTTGSW